MNQVESDVLNILAGTLHKNFFQLNTDLQWPQIYRELREQSLTPLVYPWISKTENSMDSGLKEQWMKDYASRTYRWYKFIAAQDALIQLLTEHGYAAAVMKGSANSIYYPVPQLRGSSDIDILVRWGEYKQICDLMAAEGYELLGELQESKHHAAFRKGRTVIEIHKRPGGTWIDDSQESREIIDFFQAGLDHIQHVACVGHDIPILPDVQNAMVLLLHTAQHMKEGIGLRHILDWMMFAEVKVTDEFWLTEMEPWAKKGHVETLAKNITRMCQLYLGMKVSITWCNDVDKQVCEQVMEYLFQQGDFGSKAGDADQEARLLVDVAHNGGFWKHLKESSRYSMPKVWKNRMLRPVAYMYQLIRYAIKWARRKRPLKAYRNSKKCAAKRVELFEQLGIR